MKWKIKPTKPLLPLTEWHKWFAWYPVAASDTCCGQPVEYWVWLETVMRRGRWIDNPDYIIHSQSTGYWEWSYELPVRYY